MVPDKPSRYQLTRKPSLMLLIFSMCFAFWFVDFWRPYNASRGHNNFIADIMNFYSYLPSRFCNDNSFDFHFGADSLWIPVGPKGDFVPKSTYGMSVMYAPYFALGYKIAINQGNKLDGFSEPFATCVRWGSIIYMFIGLFFLRSLLLNYFSEHVVALTLFAVLFGTMLFFYGLVQSEMAHGYLFCLFSIFLWLTKRWHDAPSLGNTVAAGLVIGLITLIRPTEILLSFFFVFWNVRERRDIPEKLRFFLRKWKLIALIIMISALWWIPQIMFWKSHTGEYLYYSYPGERFFWNDPQFMNILFSYRKGWLLYTPLVALCFAGIFFMRKKFPLSGWTIALVTFVWIYVLSCWYDWFYGGCFGAREFCQHIAFLAIPLACLIDRVFTGSDQRWWRPPAQLITLVVISSCVCLNIGQSYHYLHNKLHPWAMSKKLYWDVFRQYQFPVDYDYRFYEGLSFPDYEKLRSGEDRDQ